MKRRAPRLSDLAPLDEKEKCINVVIETSKGSRTKLAYDPLREAFVVKKVLPQGMTFPFDFGMIPSTLGEDGDPLDVLVLMEESVPPGSIVPARLIGTIDALQTEEDGTTAENDRLVAVSTTCQLFAEVRKLSDLQAAVTNQIEQFFVSYNHQEGKKFEVRGRHGRKRAEENLKVGRRRYARRKRR